MEHWVRLIEEIIEEKEVEAPKELVNYIEKVLLFRMEILERRRNPVPIDYQREREIFRKYAKLDEARITELTRIIAKNVNDIYRIQKLLKHIQDIREIKKGVKVS